MTGLAAMSVASAYMNKAPATPPFAELGLCCRTRAGRTCPPDPVPYLRQDGPMRARQRRSGFEPGRQLSPELEAAIEAEAARLAAIDDPTLAVRAVTETFIALDVALERVAEPRMTAIRRMHADGGSYAAIAEATGLSKTRVGQLYRRACRLGL